MDIKEQIADFNSQIDISVNLENDFTSGIDEKAIPNFVGH